jgi:3-dehydroquinate dehydratase-2
MSICILNGPNLNMLGRRESAIYGTQTLEQTIRPCEELCKKNSIELTHFQSNHEGEIIDFLHKNGEKFQYIIANLGAYTHTSIAIRDAFGSIKSGELPKIIELHISNVYAREEFRHKSLIASIAIAVISGLGTEGYLLATQYAINKIKG